MIKHQRDDEHTGVIKLKAEEIRQGKRAREEKQAEERKNKEMQKQAAEQKDEEMKKIEQQTDEQKMMIRKMVACVSYNVLVEHNK